MSGDARVEMRFKNAALYNAMWEMFPRPPEYRHPLYSPVKRVASLAGIYWSVLLQFLNLRRSAYYSTNICNKNIGGLPKRSAVKVAEVLGQDVETLFPRELYLTRFPNIVSKDIPLVRFVSLGAARCLAIEESSSSDLERQEREDRLSQALSTIPERKARILRLRFGLDGMGEKTLDEVANIEHVSRERIRQLESSALQLLRHPSRSRQLRFCLPGRIG